jgi:hypothetical protein
MTRNSREFNRPAGLPGDRGDDAQWNAYTLEDRALLDMSLHEDRREAGLSSLRRQPECFQVAASDQPASSPAPETPGSVGRPFLVPEGHHGHGAGWCLKPADGLEAGDHAERAVEAPAGRNGVQVRTGPKLPGRRIRTGQATEEVSPRIPFDGESRLFHPPGSQFVRGVLGAAQAGAVRSLPASDLVQALEPLEDPLGAL